MSQEENQNKQPEVAVLKPLPMHEWESQERLLNDLQNQDVTNCLEYIDFQYLKHEWDNIPVIVPRYFIYLSKYISGLSSFSFNVSLQESTESIRDDLNVKYQELQGTDKHLREVDLHEKHVINSNVQSLREDISKINIELKDAQEKKQNNLNQSMYQLYEMPDNKLFEHRDYMGSDSEKNVYSEQSREYSLDQIKELFYVHLNRSTLCHKFIDTKSKVKNCENQIKQLIVNDDTLKSYIDDQVSFLNKRFDKFEDLSQQQQTSNESKQAELSNRLSMQHDYIMKLQDFQKDSIKFQDSIRTMNEKTIHKINKERENMNQLLEHSCNELKLKIHEIDTFTTQQFDSLIATMDTFKISTIETMEQKEKSILNKTTSSIQDMRQFVDDTAFDLNQKRMEIQIKYEKKFDKVKEVITNYFERYDIDLEELKINMKVLNQKYADWSKILIEPTSLNEARLYALETRLHEEEDIRIKEYEYVRDLMKKLIFSLEQTNLQTLDIQKGALKTIDRMEQYSRGQQHTPQLPNLLQTQTINNKSGLDKQNTLNDLSLGLQHKTNEILMLKRLNFLKTSLDGHSPRQTTTNMRLKSQKKRDDRVFEIWKKELEAPSVQEILGSYMKTKQPMNIDLNEGIESQSKIQNQVKVGMSRNQDFSNYEDSVILTKRGDLQPLSTTNFETSASNVKTSNDSAFLTQKIHTRNKFHSTFDHQKLNQSLGAIDQQTHSSNIADKINRNKFLTNSDHKKIKMETQLRREDPRQKEAIKDKMHETFWSDFDNSIEKSKKIPLNQQKQQSMSRQRNGEENEVAKKLIKNLATINQDKRRNSSLMVVEIEKSGKYDAL